MSEYPIPAWTGYGEDGRANPLKIIRDAIYSMTWEPMENGRLGVEAVEVLHLLDDPNCGCEKHSVRRRLYGTVR